MHSLPYHLSNVWFSFKMLAKKNLQTTRMDQNSTQQPTNQTNKQTKMAEADVIRKYNNILHKIHFLQTTAALAEDGKNQAALRVATVSFGSLLGDPVPGLPIWSVLRHSLPSACCSWRSAVHFDTEPVSSNHFQRNWHSRGPAERQTKPC